MKEPDRDSAPEYQPTVKARGELRLRCPSCAKVYVFPAPGPGTPPACSACGAALAPEPPVKATAATPEVSPGTATQRSLPPEVNAAMSRPGSDLGRFVKLHLLGKGGMGEVWKAWEKGLRRFVALKLIRGHCAEDVERLLREAQTAAALSHPNILEVYEVVPEPEPFIVMKHIQGTTLEQATLTLRQKLEAIRDAALAIHSAHERGIIHRDLKPQNMLVEEPAAPDREPSSRKVFAKPSPRVHVMDFGLARQQSVDTSISVTGVIAGTPSFMSPEQARGKPKEVEARSDVYSLGATLYALATGRAPFEGTDLLEVVQKVQSEDPTPPRRLNRALPREVELIIARAMEKEKARRYESARALAEDLERYLEGEPILARPAGLGYRLRKRIAKNPPLSIAVGGAISIAMAGAVLLALQSSHRSAERQEELAVRTSALEAAELCRQALDHVKEAKMLWRIRTSRREQWETLFRQALEKVNAAIAKYPDFAGNHSTLGELQQAQGQWQAAIASFDRALELDSTLAETWYRRGACYQELYLETILATSFQEPSRRALDTREARRKQAQPFMDRALADLKSYSELRGVGQEQEIEPRLVQALIAYSEGRFEDALQGCEEMLGLTQADERVWLLKVRILHSMARWDDALVTIDHLVSGVMPQLPAAYLCAALIFCKLGDFEGALRQCDRMIELAPGNPRFHFVRGTIHSDFGKREAAIEDYTKAIELAPSFAAIYYNRALSKHHLKDYEGAIEDYDLAIELDPKFGPLYSSRAAASYELGDCEGAEKDCTKALELDPADSVAYMNRAMARGELGDRVGERQDYAKAMQLRPDDADVPASRGAAKLERGDYEGALEDYSLALALDAGYVSAYVGRGAARFQLGDFEGTIKDSTRAIALDSKASLAFKNRALTRSRLGDHQGAFEDYTRLIELEPMNVEAYTNRAFERGELGDYAGQIEDCNKAIELDPGLAFPYINRGAARVLLGDPAGAIEDFTRALERAPEEAVAYGNRAAARERIGDLRGALEDYTKELELSPKSRVAYRGRATVRYGLEDYQGAAEDFAMVIELDPGCAEAFVGRGKARLGMKDHRGALEDLNHAIELDGTLREQLAPLIAECRTQLRQR